MFKYAFRSYNLGVF